MNVNELKEISREIQRRGLARNRIFIKGASGFLHVKTALGVNGPSTGLDKVCAKGHRRDSKSDASKSSSR